MREETNCTSPVGVPGVNPDRRIREGWPNCGSRMLMSNRLVVVMSEATSVHSIVNVRVG